MVRLTDGDSITEFTEKPRGMGHSLMAVFVLSPKTLELIEGDQTTWEAEPMTKLTLMGQMIAFKHDGFWQPMDTLRDKNQLEKLGRAIVPLEIMVITK